MKKPDLEATFIQLNVDSGGKLPAYVKTVPFIVVYDERGQQLRLTDTQAFGWLNNRIDQLAGNFEAYDGGVMSSALSDNYSYISENGETVAPTSHQFEWINEQEKPFMGSLGSSGINTPNDATFGGGRDKAPKSDLDKLMEARNRDIPTLTRPTEIDFSKPLHQQGQQGQQGKQTPQRNAAMYAPQIRKQEVRIAAPQRGIDFQTNAFTQQRAPQQRAPQQRVPQQRVPQQSPFQRPNPVKITGRVLPQSIRR